MDDLSPADRRALLGQFFTSSAIAGFMAYLAQGLFPQAVRLLNPRAGQRALTAKPVRRGRLALFNSGYTP